MHPALALSCLLLCAFEATRAQSAGLEATLARSGDNRAELERALRDVPAEQREALEFLLVNMPPGDAVSMTSAQLLREVTGAAKARAAVPWGDQLGDAMFHNYVLPYAQANETREDWRSGFAARFLPVVASCRTPGEAAQRLNETVFDAVGVHYSTARARPDQSPAESIAQGKASCTGLSILLADACRACCVPARLVSVKWPHKAGNHTWVEVWDGEAWRFCGADEPDPQGLDRAWFTADAARCADADHEHRIWAVSYAETGERFRAGWGRQIELWGTDVTARYAQDPGGGDAALAAQLDRFFTADAAVQATFGFDRNLDQELGSVEGDARLRGLVAAAWKRAELTALSADHEARIARAGGKESPFTVKQVGDKPAAGWPLVIAMHGGGGVPKEVNDSQWRHMQIYYKDHAEVSGYLYCALRAPTNEWNGFYTDYFYPVIEKLIRQFIVCDDVDPDRVIAIGYSHGGYGAFVLGPKLPHRFAPVHASAAAPTDGQTSPVGLHSLKFSFMVGGKDTAYDRRSRCEAFEELLRPLKQAPLGEYPTEFTLVEGNGHGGLPDRDLLRDLLPSRRTALPTYLAWQPTDGVVRDHYWLHCQRPQAVELVIAARKGNTLAVTIDGDGEVEGWLDARLLDLGKPVMVSVNDVARPVTPSPSLRTLCATMLERGDPRLAASWVLPFAVE